MTETSKSSQLISFLEKKRNPFYGLQEFLKERPDELQICSQRLLNILEQITMQVLDKRDLELQDVYSIQLVLETIQHLASYTVSAEGLHILITNGLERMITVLITALHWVREKKSEAADHLFEDVLETITAIAEYSPEARNKMIQLYCDRLLQVSTSTTFRFLTKFETTKSVNLLLEQCPVELRDAMACQSNHCEMMHKIAALIPLAGDYEFQVSLTETLFRLTHKGNRKKLAMTWFKEEIFLMAFLSVRDSEFEVDSRQFLNIINDKKYGIESVRSFPCQKAVIGNYEIHKPDDENYSDFWVDFNTGSRRLTLFCLQVHQEGEKEDADNLWETVSIWEDNLIGYEIKEERGCNILFIQTLSNAKDLIGFGPNFVDRNVLIQFDKKFLLHEAMTKTFNEKQYSESRPKMKVSVPMMPKPVNDSSIYAEVNYNMSMPLSQDSQLCSSQKSQRSYRRKVSNPSVRMNRPSNLMISSNTNSSSNDKSEITKSHNKGNRFKGKATEAPKTPKSATPKAKRVKTPLKMVSTNLNNSSTNMKSSKAETDINVRRGSKDHVSVKETHQRIDNSDIIPSSAPEEQVMIVPDSQPQTTWNLPALSGNVLKSRDFMARNDSRVCMDVTNDVIVDMTKENQGLSKDPLADFDSDVCIYPKNILKVSTTPCLSTVTEESYACSSKRSSQFSVKQRLHAIQESIENAEVHEGEFPSNETKSSLGRSVKNVIQMSPDSTSQVIAPKQGRKNKVVPLQKDVFDCIEERAKGVTETRSRTTRSRARKQECSSQAEDNSQTIWEDESQQDKGNKPKKQVRKAKAKPKNKISRQNSEEEEEDESELQSQDVQSKDNNSSNIKVNKATSKQKAEGKTNGKQTIDKGKSHKTTNKEIELKCNEKSEVNATADNVKKINAASKTVSYRSDNSTRENKQSSENIDSSPKVLPSPTQQKSHSEDKSQPTYKKLTLNSAMEKDINVYNFSQESDVISMTCSQDPSLMSRSKLSTLNLSLDRGASKLSLKKTVNEVKQPVNNKPKFFKARAKQKEEEDSALESSPELTTQNKSNKDLSDANAVKNKRHPVDFDDNVISKQTENKSNKAKSGRDSKAGKQASKTNKLCSLSKLKTNTSATYEEDIAESFGFGSTTSVSVKMTSHRKVSTEANSKRDSKASKIKTASQRSYSSEEIQIEDSSEETEKQMDNEDVPIINDAGIEADVSTNVGDVVSDFTLACQRIVDKSSNMVEQRKTRAKKKVNYKVPSESDFDLEERSLPATPNPNSLIKRKKATFNTEKEKHEKKEPKKYRHRKNVFSDTGEDTKSEVSWLCNSSCKKKPTLEKTYKNKMHSKQQTDARYESNTTTVQPSPSQFQEMDVGLFEEKENYLPSKGSNKLHGIQAVAQKTPQQTIKARKRQKATEHTEEYVTETYKPQAKPPKKKRKSEVMQEMNETVTVPNNKDVTDVRNLYFGQTEGKKKRKNTTECVVNEIESEEFALELRTLFNNTINSSMSSIMAKTSQKPKTDETSCMSGKQTKAKKLNQVGQKHYKKLDVQVLKTPVAVSCVDELVEDEMECCRLENPQSKQIETVVNISPIIPLSQISVMTEEGTNTAKPQSVNDDPEDMILSQGSALTHISSLKTPKTPKNYRDVMTDDEEDEEINAEVIPSNTTCGLTGVKSGPCKRKSKEACDILSDEESPQSTYSRDSSKVFKPRQLFSLPDMNIDQAVITLTSPVQAGVKKGTQQEEEEDSSEEMEENDDVCREKHTNDKMYVTPDNSFNSGVKTLIASFGSDIQRSMMLKMKQLQNITKQTVKTTHRNVCSIWNKQKERRQNVLDEFKSILLKELTQLEKEMGKTKQAEEKVMEFFKQQLKVMQLTRISQEQSLQNLMKAQQNFCEEVEEVEKATHKDGIYLKNTVKNELQTLKQKIMVQTQQQEIANVKRSLQAMFF